MSTVAVILLIVAVVFVLFFLGGYLSARRRRGAHLDEAIAAADRALAHAHASDRGWDRALLDEAARHALAGERPDFVWETLHLVLVDDRPGVAEDRAHVRASGRAGSALVVLRRSADGAWQAESVD